MAWFSVQYGSRSDPAELDSAFVNGSAYSADGYKMTFVRVTFPCRVPLNRCDCCPKVFVVGACESSKGD